MLLVKNAKIYTPDYIGQKDVLICGGKIEKIVDKMGELPFEYPTIDGTGMKLVPGFIDQHVHITGGGGEGSFHTRAPEVQLSQLIEGGITTVVGLLGTDGITRSVENLYAKMKSLQEEGISAYMLTGAYGYPGPTIIGRPDKDLVFVEEVLGVKLAISDHRAPNITEEELTRLASDMRVAGMLSGKPGFITLHMGDAETGLGMVREILRKTEIPMKMFRPTHVNRKEELLEEAYEFLKDGGYIDLTCQIKKNATPGDCILRALERGLPTERVTASSDGQGSWSEYAEDGTLLRIGVSGVDALMKELRYMVDSLGFALEQALPYMTRNVAKALGLSKGEISEGKDADLLLLDENLEIKSVIARGEVMMNDGILLRKGTYEK